MMPDLDLAITPSIQHVIIHHDGSETVQIRTTDCCICLRLQGDRVLNGPVELTFQVPGLAHIRTAATKP